MHVKSLLVGLPAQQELEVPREPGCELLDLLAGQPVIPRPEVELRRTTSHVRLLLLPLLLLVLFLRTLINKLAPFYAVNSVRGSR